MDCQKIDDVPFGATPITRLLDRWHPDVTAPAAQTLKKVLRRIFPCMILSAAPNGIAARSRIIPIMTPQSPTGGLLAGLAVTLLAVALFSWHALTQIDGLQQLQTETID